ncbi:amidohydrolase family protein [Gemmobacter sp. 24YEA27]|uniref:amidohydrolase family protein n=1 Tax=Gemmobacter sp. 24YEA27 TaxID=3040672 RepID=UPI0024B3492C|nr:amidohydrolase family protein [Gemmobacter sp. 24YEA27]
MEQLPVDSLIRNGFVIIMDAGRRCLPNGAIAISGGRIVDVGPEAELLTRYRADKVIDARGGTVHPGFIDTHVHFMNTARGALPDTLETGTMMNVLRRWWDLSDLADERAATMLNCLEMLSNGTTCFLEAGTLKYADAAAEAAAELGIRGFIGDPFLWDLPISDGVYDMSRAARDLDRSLDLLGGQLKRNTAVKEPLIRGCVVVFGLGSASDELLQAAKSVADANGVILTMHQSFDHHDAGADAARLGKRAICHYADHGLLGENMTFSHMNDLDPDEAKLAAEAGVTAVWCPVTSMNLGAQAAKHARHLEMRRHGANVSLASDGVASGCRYDVGFQGLVALLGTRAKGDGQQMTAMDVLELATIGGAKAVGMAADLGSLEPGKYADIVIRSTDLPEAHPWSDPVQSLVYNCGSKSVDRVIVNGVLVWADGHPQLVDAAKAYDEARHSHLRMLERLDMKPRWQADPPQNTGLS